MITQIASTATKNLGGQKQLIRRPTAKVTASIPLLKLQRLRILIPPQTAYNTVYREIVKMLLNLILLHIPRL